MKQARTLMLLDNASLDEILHWDSKARTLLNIALGCRRLVVYLAPETAAELLSLGSTARVSTLSSLATLTLELVNGRFLNHYFTRILAEVRGQPSQPFLGAGLTRQWQRNISECAKAVDLSSYKESFQKLEEMVRREKVEDQILRKEYQDVYRNRRRKGMSNRSSNSLDEFVESSMIQDLVRIRVESICEEAELEAPNIRADEIIRNKYAGCPALAAHMHIRIIRSWWYTESTCDGRHVSADLFDDALLNYLMELDVMITPDRKLIEFGKVALPEKRLLTPSEFKEEYLKDV